MPIPSESKKNIIEDPISSLCRRGRNFILFWQTAAHSPPRHPREINYVTIHVDLECRAGPKKKRTCPVQIYPYPFSLFLFLFALSFWVCLHFLYFLSPSLPRFRSVDILPVPIVKHPRRRYAIVALWVAWEPERADSGMRPGILTCWTSIVELPTSLCPRCVVHVVIQRRDRATSFAGHNRTGGPLAFMNLSRTWTPI